MKDSKPLVRNVPDPANPADPVLDKLSQWVENALGIKAGEDSLQKLKEYLEQNFGPTIFEFPGAFEMPLSSREERFKIARYLTINETYFFREEPHFDLLLKELLPRFARLNRPLRICSAATSTGCEAYSLAMLMDHYNRTVGPLDFQIEAFDVSRDVIEIAKQGRYTVNSFRADGNRWKYIMDDYLKELGGEYIVSSKLKERIHFFPYNIMDGLKPETFDLILFRNALIYFSAESRARLLDSLANALTEGGVLLFGISETPSVNHPLLRNKTAQETFYFEKDSSVPQISDPGADDRRSQDRRATDRRSPDRKEWNFPDRRVSDRRTLSRRAELPAAAAQSVTHNEVSHPAARSVPVSGLEGSRRTGGFTINMKNIASLIEQGESLPAAELILKALKDRTVFQAEETAALEEDELIAAVISLLSLEDFAGVDLALSLIEKKRESAFTKFLRGEYYYHLNRIQEAETGYKEASSLDGTFWPAFYRMSLLAAEGNRTRYEYKIKKALESIELGKELNYECFIGGFSPDYYRRILEKRLSADFSQAD